MLEGRKTIFESGGRGVGFLCETHSPFNEFILVTSPAQERQVGSVAICLPATAWSIRLDPDSWRTIKEDFGQSYIWAAQDPGFARTRTSIILPH